MTKVDAVQDRYVVLNSLRFHYREWGAADAPALVVLHGFNSQSRDWDFTTSGNGMMAVRCGAATLP